MKWSKSCNPCVPQCAPTTRHPQVSLAIGSLSSGLGRRMVSSTKRTNGWPGTAFINDQKRMPVRTREKQAACWRVTTSPKKKDETTTRTMSLVTPARMKPTAETSLIRVATNRLRMKASEALGSKRCQNCTARGTIWASQMKMFPTSRTAKHVGAAKSVYVSGSSLKLEPLKTHSPSTTREHSTNCEMSWMAKPSHTK